MPATSRKIAEALAALEREGVLAPDQRAAVARRLEEALPRRGDHAGRFVSILAALGAVLVGAGILYLVAYNWDELSKVAKLSIVFWGWLSIHLAGYRLSESPGRYPRVGRALTVLGVLCFGAAIALVAQIYHLSSEYPNSVLAWWALSIPFVLITASTPILLVVLALFLVWVLWHTGVWIGNAPGSDIEAYVTAFALEGVALAALFAALGAWTSTTRYRHFAPVFAGLARPAAIGGVYALTFKDVEWSQGIDGSRAFAGAGAIALAAIAVLAAAVALRGRRERVVDGLVLLAVTTALAGTLWRAPEATGAIANVLYLAGIVGLVAAGIRRGRPSDIHWGLAAFVLGLVTRYVEYLWDKLTGAYAFIGIGLLLLAVGFVLERNRRRWVAMSAGRSA